MAFSATLGTGLGGSRPFFLLDAVGHRDVTHTGLFLWTVFYSLGSGRKETHPPSHTHTPGEHPEVAPPALRKAPWTGPAELGARAWGMDDPQTQG